VPVVSVALVKGCLVDRARSRSARIAAHSAGPCLGLELTLPRRAASTYRENGEQLLQLVAVAGRTGRRLSSARQVLEMMAAGTALVFEKRHELL
jgi:hypothetical protein